MKVNPTVALTLILLALMGGAGIISAAWGYALGREALKGITQPDVRPLPAGSEDAQSQPRHQEMMIVPETKILEEVKGRISGNGAIAQPENAQSSTMQPIQSGAVVPPAYQPNAVQPSVLSPAPPSNLPPDVPPGDLPPNTLQPAPLSPSEFSPSGFNPLLDRDHPVGVRLPQVGSGDSMAGSMSDRLLANHHLLANHRVLLIVAVNLNLGGALSAPPKFKFTAGLSNANHRMIDGATSNYGVERVSLFFPFNRHG